MTDFDTWVATFGETVTQLEMPPEGGNVPRRKSRFARFFNVPELLRGQASRDTEGARRDATAGKGSARRQAAGDCHHGPGERGPGAGMADTRAA
jgi:hypothetical protein